MADISTVRRQDSRFLVQQRVPDSRFSYAGHDWRRGIFSNELQLARGNGWLCLVPKRGNKGRNKVWDLALNDPIFKGDK